MTTAVLKNRLLNLTRGQFSEGRYGSPSFIHLVRRISDLVTVISEQPPHYLRLVTPASSHGGAVSLSSASAIEVDAAVAESGIGDDELAGMRVRDDLWHAGWPGGISPPGSHRTERDSLPSLRSSHL
jgi:hypothetical protein